METAMVTAIGSFSADIVIKTLKNKNIRVIGSDIYPKEWVVDAYNVDTFYQAPLAINTKEYLHFVMQVCEIEDIKYIFPLTDVEVDVFADNMECFETIGVRICISPKSVITLCRNKKLLADYLGTNNVVQVIPTYFVKEVIKEPEKYPVICKPCNGRSSQGLRVVRNSFEWNGLLQEDSDKIIVQPFIEGNIVTVDIVRQRDGKKCVAIAREELLRTLNGAGTSVKVFSDSKLENMCTTIADSLGIVGCANFEFIKDTNGEYHFLECNPRFSGGVEFSFMIGYDIVGNHLKCFQEKEISEIKAFPVTFIARKYEEFITKIEK